MSPGGQGPGLMVLIAVPPTAKSEEHLLCKFRAKKSIAFRLNSQTILQRQGRVLIVLIFPIIVKKKVEPRG